MDEFDFWRLADSFTLPQAALLIAGVEPSNYQGIRANGTIYLLSSNPEIENNCNAAFNALINAVRKGTLKAQKVYKSSDFNEWRFVKKNFLGEAEYSVQEDCLDIEETLVTESDLKEWLRSRGFKSGFFFPEKAEAPDYLNPKHPCYAPKLAASVTAWVAASKVTDSNKSPKALLEIELRKNALLFGMIDEKTGNPSKNAVEQCAQVANWNTKGGAPKSIPQAKPVTDNE